MSKLPFMQFYPADWLQDTQILSLEAQGAWLKILCAMWVAPDRGTICLGYGELETFWGRSRDAVEQLIDDLSGVADIKLRDSAGNMVKTHDEAAEITIVSRRMVRDENKRKQGLEADRRYRERETSKKRPKNVAKTSRIYQKSEVRSHISDKDKEGVFEIPDWIPLQSWEAYLKHRKLKRAKVTPEAAHGLIEKLLEFKKQGEDITAILKQSVINGWTGLFPIGKGNGRPTPDLAHSTVPVYKPIPAEPRPTKEQQAKVKVMLRELTEKIGNG